MLATTIQPTQLDTKRRPGLVATTNLDQGKITYYAAIQEGPYKVTTWINDAVYRIQCHPKVKMMVVQLDRLAPYLGATQDEQPYRGSNIMQKAWRQDAGSHASMWKPLKLSRHAPSSCNFQKVGVPCLSCLHQTFLEI
jgi:hypothetical protein